MKHLVMALLSLITLSSVTTASDTVQELDLNRYQGTWYEVARLPNWFQKKCRRDITAIYEWRPDGKITVINTCVSKEGKRTKAKGVARLQTSDSPSKLEVSFFSVLGFRPGWGDYWVFYLDRDYNLAVVGDRNLKYAWILSRTPSLSTEQLSLAKSVLAKRGVDLSRLIYAN